MSARLLVAGLFLVVLAIGIAPSGFVFALDPAASGERLASLMHGASLFRGLLAFHGFVLLAASFAVRRDGGAADARRSAPLWSPSAEPGAWLGRRADTVAVALILALAVGLRALRIDTDLWMDEVFTLVDFVRLPAGAIATSYPSDNQHLLYSLLARVCVVVLGESAGALRIPAAAFGVASLWATWRLGRLVFGARHGLLAAALLAVSYHHVWFSQNARGYTGLLLGTVLSTELLLRALWTGRARLWIGYAVTLALATSVHLTMVFVPAAHALVVLALAVSQRRGRAMWKPAGAWALAASLTLQVHALVLPQMLAFFSTPGAGTTNAPLEWKSPLWLVNETLRGLGLNLALGWSGLAAGAALFAAGGLGLLRRDRIAAVLMALPAFLGGAILLALGRNLWPRFFFHEAGFAALFAVEGALVLGHAIARRTGATATSGPRIAESAIALLLVLGSAASLPRVYALPKQDWSGARDFVRAERGPDDLVVAVDLAGIVYGRYYAPEFARADDSGELAALRVHARQGSVATRTWVLYTLPRYLAVVQPDLLRVLESEFDVARTFPGTLGDGAIVVARERDAARAPR